MTTRVLVVDEQVLVRAGLTALIDAAADLVVAGQTGDGVEAVRLAATTSPAVVLIDVRMRGVVGLSNACSPRGPESRSCC